MNRRIAIAEAELQLMVHLADVEELRPVEAFLLLRAIGNVGVEVVVVHARGIAPARRSAFALSAVAIEAETTGDLRPHTSEVEARTDDLRVFELVDGGRTDLPPRRFKWTGRRKVPRVANFVAPRIEADRAVAGHDLR